MGCLKCLSLAIFVFSLSLFLSLSLCLPFAILLFLLALNIYARPGYEAMLIPTVLEDTAINTESSIERKNESVMRQLIFRVHHKHNLLLSCLSQGPPTCISVIIYGFTHIHTQYTYAGSTKWIDAIHLLLSLCFKVAAQ